MTYYNKKEFKNLLRQAIDGNREALGKIIELYMPLVNKHSYINGRFDEDLRQQILLMITLRISQFQIKDSLED